MSAQKLGGYALDPVPVSVCCTAYPHLTSPWSGGGSDASLEKTSLLFQHIRARIYFANCQVGEKK